jgi:hypothetical protein
MIRLFPFNSNETMSYKEFFKQATGNSEFEPFGYQTRLAGGDSWGNWSNPWKGRWMPIMTEVVVGTPPPSPANLGELPRLATRPQPNRRGNSDGIHRLHCLKTNFNGTEALLRNSIHNTNIKSVLICLHFSQ